MVSNGTFDWLQDVEADDVVSNTSLCGLSPFAELFVSMDPFFISQKLFLSFADDEGPSIKGETALLLNILILFKKRRNLDILYNINV